MQKVKDKEIINRAKTEIMQSAIDYICENKSEEEIKKLNSEHQKQILKEADVSEALKAQKEKQLREISFKMVSYYLS